MGIISSFFSVFDTPTETKNITVPRHSEAVIEAAIRADTEGDFSGTSVSAVYCAARVIAEGLAVAPCHLVNRGARGQTLATDNSLYYLLHDSPNSRQTSYEFREQIGLHLALNGNAHVWINRSRATGEILELLPLDPGVVTQVIDPANLGAPVRYFIFGREVAASEIWHLKGPSWLSYQGIATLAAARSAIRLAKATEVFGSKLFENGARPGGIVTIGSTTTQEKINDIRTMWAAQYSGANNSHRTAFLTGDVNYTPLSSTANDAQAIEARRFQVEEICRYFRVSPTKVFHMIGSQSYASVEQSHIAHDQDTDAHWHQRFCQSANKALLTDKDRRNGLSITIDNRDFLRGTAVERMTYYTAGIGAGIFSRNEAREMEGFDRSDDPEADKLTPAANLFGGPSLASDK